MPALDLRKARADLREHGYALLPGAIDADLRQRLRERLEQLFEQEGDAAGSEFRTEHGARRLANLVNKGEVFHGVIRHAAVLACVESVFETPFKLSSLNARCANPRTEEGQPLHVDMGFLADERGAKGVNAVWMLDDFTTGNGALRVVPGSHRRNARPQEVLDDPLAPHPDEIVVTGGAGGILILQAHLWHAGLANRTSRQRLALNAFYCRNDQAQQLWQKKWLDPAVQAGLDNGLRKLLALDDPRNDALCSRPVETSGFMKADATIAVE